MLTITENHPSQQKRGQSYVPALVSVLIPLYNEEEFIEALIERVLSAPLPESLDRELVIVDDCSTDGSREIAEKLADRYPNVIRVFSHKRNSGKGSAIRTAIQHVQTRGRKLM